MAHEKFWVAVVKPHRDKLMTTAQASTLLREVLASGQAQEVEMEFKPPVGYSDLWGGWLMGTLRKLEGVRRVDLRMYAYDPNNPNMQSASFVGPSHWVDDFRVTELRVRFGQEEVVPTRQVRPTSVLLKPRPSGEVQTEFVFDDSQPKL